MTYLVSVRMLASTLILPFLYCLSMVSAELGAYVQSFIRFHDVSSGTYSQYALSSFTPTDLYLSLGQGLVISTVVISVALYLGYNVRGGPVEVGVATARSMGISLVLVTPRESHLGAPVPAEGSSPDRVMRPARVVTLFALLLAAAAGLLILTSGASTYAVTAVFQQANGLIAGGRVVAGWSAGRRGPIRQARQRGLPRVAMQIDDGYRLRQGRPQTCWSSRIPAS